MAYKVYRGKKGTVPASCHKKKAAAKRAAEAIRNAGGHARVRKVKSCA